MYLFFSVVVIRLSQWRHLRMITSYQFVDVSCPALSRVTLLSPLSYFLCCFVFASLRRLGLQVCFSRYHPAKRREEFKPPDNPPNLHRKGGRHENTSRETQPQARAISIEIAIRTQPGRHLPTSRRFLLRFGCCWIAKERAAKRLSLPPRPNRGGR